jgi:glycosyltransferase involved in cell wall biosynthesis
MSADPLVSLVIPVLNGERHLEACLTSIVGQTYEHIEVVVADQASTDRSVEIVRSFDDPRIRILPESTEPLGLHANWARAVDASRGELVKIVCQDDVLLSECVSIQVDLMKKHPAAVLVCGRRRIIDDHDKVLIGARGLGRFAKGGTQLASGGALARACARAGSNVLGEPVNVLFRKSALPDKLFDPRWVYAIDIEFYLRCLQDRPAVVDSRVVCCFRVSPNQLSAALAKGQAKELRALFTEMARRYPEHVSNADVRLGAARAQLLAQARRVLYWQMRTRAAIAGERGRDDVGRARSRSWNATSPPEVAAVEIEVDKFPTASSS